MKPKYLCSECNTEIQWGDRFCGKCGKAIEWPASFFQAEHASPDPQQRGARSESRKSQSAKKEEFGSGVSWKAIAGFAAFLVIGALALEMLTSKKSEIALPPQAQPDQPPSANMGALSQIEGLEKQVKANPADMKLTLELANLLHDNRFYDRAISYYSRYLGKNPKDPDAQVDMGICYFDLGKLDDAQKHMRQALKWNPKHLLAHFNLGIVTLKAGRVKEANEWFRKTVALDPNSSAAQQAKQILEQHSTL